VTPLKTAAANNTVTMSQQSSNINNVKAATPSGVIVGAAFKERDSQN
jgi:hypothetical protein